MSEPLCRGVDQAARALGNRRSTVSMREMSRMMTARRCEPGAVCSRLRDFVSTGHIVHTFKCWYLCRSLLVTENGQDSARFGGVLVGSRASKMMLMWCGPSCAVSTLSVHHDAAEPVAYVQKYGVQERPSMYIKMI